MSLSRNVTVKIIKNKARLDSKLYFYEKDYGVTINFLIQEYQFRYDKNPTGILSSINDDVLYAYTTIVNPMGMELTRQNGTIVDDVIQFVLTDDLTDELNEIGVYKLQFHIKCEHSEISIPPIEFEIKERLKGITDIIPAIVGTAVVGKSIIEED